MPTTVSRSDGTVPGDARNSDLAVATTRVGSKVRWRTCSVCRPPSLAPAPTDTTVCGSHRIDADEAGDESIRRRFENRVGASTCSIAPMHTAT